MGAYTPRAGGSVPDPLTIGTIHATAIDSLTLESFFATTVGGTLNANGNVIAAVGFRHTGSQLGFYNAPQAVKQTVTGAKGSNAALGSLMAALSTLGLVTDSTSA